MFHLLYYIDSKHCLTNACSGTALDTESTVNNLSLALVIIVLNRD